MDQQMIEARGAGYREQKARAEELAAENAWLKEEMEQRHQTIQQAETPAQPGEFSNEHFYQLLNAAPRASIRYALADMFGVQDPVRAFNTMREEAWANVQRM